MPRAAPAVPIVVAVDPAARSYAYAVFDAEGLAHVGVNAPGTLPPVCKTAPIWILETPQNYVRKGESHEDLERLRAVVEGIAALVTGTVEYVHPHAWKGNVPKAVHHRRVWACLDPIERLVVGDGPDVRGYNEDIMDAVALGLFRVGRLKRGGTK